MKPENVHTCIHKSPHVDFIKHRKYDIKFISLACKKSYNCLWAERFPLRHHVQTDCLASYQMHTQREADHSSMKVKVKKTSNVASSADH
jgi:hypothetical protein